MYLKISNERGGRGGRIMYSQLKPAGRKNGSLKYVSQCVSEPSVRCAMSQQTWLPQRCISRHSLTPLGNVPNTANVFLLSLLWVYHGFELCQTEPAEGGGFRFGRDTRGGFKIIIKSQATPSHVPLSLGSHISPFLDFPFSLLSTPERPTKNSVCCPLALALFIFWYKYAWMLSLSSKGLPSDELAQIVHPAAMTPLPPLLSVHFL